MPSGKYIRKKRIKQEFSFPSKEQPKFSDAELDAEIDGTGLHEKKFSDSTNTKKKTELIAAAKEIPAIFSPEQVEWLFDIYTGILCFIYSFIFKTDFKPLFEELKFDEDQKKVFSKPLAKIASKYAPVGWAGMTAEIELAVSIGMYTVMSFKRAEMVAKKEAERKQKEEMEKRRVNNRNTVTPVSANVG